MSKYRNMTAEELKAKEIYNNTSVKVWKIRGRSLKGVYSLNKFNGASVETLKGRFSNCYKPNMEIIIK